MDNGPGGPEMATYHPRLAVMGTATTTRLLAAGSTTILALALAVAGATDAALASGHPAPGAAGLGDRLFPTLGNGGYDVVDYALHLTYPGKDPRQQVTGDVTISAAATQDLSRFDLDFGGDAVGAVAVNGRSATFTREGDELVITPGRELAAGRPFTVRVTGFVTAPASLNLDAPAGLMLTPDGTVLAGQPASAHKVFPSNDHPRDKATYTITLTVPAGWTGTASGAHVATRTRGDQVSYTFRENHPMASELVQAAAGDFVVHRRPPVHGVSMRDVVSRRLDGDWLPRFDEADLMTWMDRRAGPYPFNSYGALVVDADLGFALETQTLSLYPGYVTSSPDYVLKPVLAHELAHQWFGNSVAPYEWSDVWLNEGHATWYEMHYADEYGYLEGWTDHATLEDYFKSLYAAGDTYRAAYGPVARPARAETLRDLFNNNVYEGGALALYALQQKIGAERFQQLQREWTSRFRGRSGSTGDFINLASVIAGQDLAPFLRDWLYGTTTPPMPGHPDWTVDPVRPAKSLRATAKQPIRYR
jgi:aminopeptidase N